jgi:ferredoxin
MKKYPAFKRGKASVDVEKCFGCGACVVKCPVEGVLRLELADRVTAL